jgi:hypothetical protein
VMRDAREAIDKRYVWHFKNRIELPEGSGRRQVNKE